MKHREVKQMLPPGYSFANGGKHPYIVGPDGKAVRGPDGRKIVFQNGSGGRSRALANFRALLRQLEIL